MARGKVKKLKEKKQDRERYGIEVDETEKEERVITKETETRHI